MKKKIIAQAVAALATVAVSGVWASGFQLLEQNASGLGNAYAGSAAVSENASTIFFNPAGMTQLKSLEVSGGVNVIKPTYKFQDSGSSMAPATTGTNGGDAGSWTPVPNGYMSWGVTKDIYVGVGFSAPFGLKTEYDSDWVGRFQSTKFDIKTYNVNPSVAYKINDKVSLGLGFNYQRMEAEYQRQAAVGVPPFASAALNSAAQNTTVTLDADDNSVGWNAGILLTPSSTTKVGISYRSKVKYKLKGTLTSNNQALAPNVNATAYIELPDTLILSTTQKLDDRWEMLGDLSWTGWSSIGDVPIVRSSGASSGTTAQTLEARFRDTWRLALGANYKLNDAWKIKTGIAYDMSPVKSAQERLVSLPDNDRIWFSAGAQWKMSAASTIDLGGSYIYVRKTRIDNNQTAQGRGRVTGDYDGSVFILGAQYSMAF